MDSDRSEIYSSPNGMKWTGSSIRNLSMHRKCSTATRLDVAPFLLFYLSWLVLVLSSHRGVVPFLLDLFWSLFGFFVLILIHAVVLLGQHWSVRFHVAVAYVQVKPNSAPIEADLTRFRILVIPKAHRGKPELIVLQQSSSNQHREIYFMFQQRQFVAKTEDDPWLFRKVRYPSDLPLEYYGSVSRSSGGVHDHEINDKLRYYGANLLEIPMPLFWDLYKESLLSPFFVFQVFCIALWLLDEYWQYSLMTLVVMMFSEAVVVKGRMRSLQELRGMRSKPRRVHVYRNKKWVVVSSLELVPGDILSVVRGASEEDTVPCDALLLAGSVVVNEAILTGESVPLIKEGISLVGDEDGKTCLNLKSEHKGHIVFAGTSVLTHTPGAVSPVTPNSKTPDSGCIAFVLRTGFGSSQGKLMKTIMYSTQQVSGNSKDAGFLILFLLMFAIAASSYVLKHGMETQNKSRYKLLLHCIMIVTMVVPPELPMQLSLAVNTALLQLVRDGVFCTEPFRIPLGGKVDVCCFDKTGTLTTDKIKAVGLAFSSDPPNSESEGYPMLPVAESPLDAQLILAGCHSLVHVDNALVGDPLELEALDSVQWTFTRGGDSAVPKRGSKYRAGLRIIYRNRFVSALQRMSVVARVEIDGEKAPPRVLVKGSAEAIRNLLAGPVPPGYDETASSLARKGMRVLALAYRPIEEDSPLLKPSPREETERDLTFAGFIAFECPLREDSRKIVRQLRRSSHKVCMITGDATLTAVHVARQVGIVSSPTLILEDNDHGELNWVSAQTGRVHGPFVADDVRRLRKSYSLCVSGHSLQLASAKSPRIWGAMDSVSVFARMSPDAKEKVLLALRDQGLHTLMCGDGTNDVGALKQSHIGVALLSRTEKPKETKDESKTAPRGTAIGKEATVRAPSSSTGTKVAKKSTSIAKPSKAAEQAVPPLSDVKNIPSDPQEELRRRLEELNKALDEDTAMVKMGDASIASPFTSRTMSIESCAKIIRQGRCTLATTLTMYQILSLNSLISAYSLSVLHLDGIKFGDRQMTVVGLCMTAAFFLMSRSKALKELSAERPANSIFAPRLFLSLLVQFALHLATLMYCVQEAKKWLPEDFKVQVDGEFEPNVLNGTVFLISSAQQVSVFLTNFRGRPFMEGIMENVHLRRVLFFVFGVILLCTGEVIPDLNILMQVAPFPSTTLKQALVTAMVLDLIGAFLLDRFFHLILTPKARSELD